MRYSEDIAFNAAQGNKSTLCNQEGGAVSKDIFLKFFQNIPDKNAGI